VFKALDDAKWLAGEMMSSGDQLVQMVRELSGSINMRFLYNSSRRLFSIGYNSRKVGWITLFTTSWQSEARLGASSQSRGGTFPPSTGCHEQALRRHRPGAQVLLSWTGTMFEYLMPLLSSVRLQTRCWTRRPATPSQSRLLRPQAPRAVGHLGVCVW